jgi:dienelactone hydrolase
VQDYALTGQDDVKALVSFHGGLSDIPDSDPTVGPKLLVLSGGYDDESSDIMDLEDSLSLANASWEITRYSGIEHAFTVFSDSRYNVWADVRSWYSMNKFLSEAFGLAFFDGKKPDMFDVMAMNYTDVDGAALTGYYTAPDMMGDTNKTVPTVVILPDWDGVNTYEKDRATLLAMSGYAAFAADIYGSDLQENLDFPTRIAQSNLYRNDPGLFNQRIQTAIDLVKTFPEVDSDNIAVIGYCFGGTGVMEYAFSGSTDVKVIASFHGGHQMMPQTPEIAIAPYVLVLSGGIDDAHGNQTEMEAAMNARNASWEITRYAKVDHGYTSWYSGAYNLMADARSWDSMMSTFAALMPVEGNMMVVEGPEFEQVEVPNDEGNLDDDSSGAFSTTLLNVLVASALTLFLAALM